MRINPAFLAFALFIMSITKATADPAISHQADLPSQTDWQKTSSNHNVNSKHLTGTRYRPDDGSYPVAVLDEINLEDRSRVKFLPVKITFPKAPGPFPVIIFSHGAGGSKETYASLSKYWASYGYVCIQPSHADSIELRIKNGQDANFVNILRSIGTDINGWKNRAQDIIFLIDSLAELEEKSPLLYKKMDLSHVGVGGHSYGAFTTQLIGGARPDVPGWHDFSDKRVSALLLLSAQGRTSHGLGFGDQHSWDHMILPMMLMTGSRDKGMMGQSPAWREEPFVFCPPGDKYMEFIEGATHMTFTGNPGAETDPVFLPALQTNQQLSAPPRSSLRTTLRRRLLGSPSAPGSAPTTEPIFDFVKMGSLAFWDAYLKNDNSAKSYLRSSDLESFSKGIAKLEHK